MNHQPSNKLTSAVQRMYEEFPYPSPAINSTFIPDLANMVGLLFPDPEEKLSGWNILDAGCGTGQRLVALAQNYPEAQLTGLDITEASLRVAEELIRVHKISNVKLQRSDLLELQPSVQYDLIVSIGVIHHLADPQQGLGNLISCLSPDGLLLVWLYHPLGEFDRLLQRELALLLLGSPFRYTEGLGLLQDLNLGLSPSRYGGNSSILPVHAQGQTSAAVDAFLHPVVNTYRFHEALELFRKSGAQWVALNSISAEGQAKIVDLENAGNELYQFVSTSGEELFGTARLKQRYVSLTKADRMKAIELFLKPTGFSVLAGKNRSFEKCDKRIEKNLI